ncbi:MAG TPA: branched-chain amino acid ABC transporter permease/ATP-binding protein [Acidimicrobiales bacterium]
MSEFIRFVLLGLAAGALYVPGAIGLVLIHRGSGVINFAHGAMGMVGAFLYWELADKRGWPTVAAVAVGVAFAALLGALTHLIVMRQLARASLLTKLIASLGVMAVLQSAAALRYTEEIVLVRPFLPSESVDMFGIVIGEDRLWILGGVIVAVCLLWAIYRFTPFGLATTAVADNPVAAAGAGISTDLVSVANWAIGAGLAGAAGIVLSPLIGLQVTGLTVLIIPMLAAAVIGRMSSFPITLAAGLLIGVCQSLLGRYSTTPGLGSAVPFVLVAAVLIWRGRVVIPPGEAGARLPAIGTGVVRPPLVVLLAAAGLFAVWSLPTNWVDAVTLQLTVAIVLLSLVVVTGYAGQLSLAQFAFAGLGAWFAGQLVAERSVPFELAVVLAVVGVIPVGLALGVAGLRTRGVNLTIVTLGFAVALDSIIFSNSRRTGGFSGYQVGAPDVFGIDVSAIVRPERYALLALVVFVVVALLVSNLRRSRTGRRLIAVRSNERAAESLGISVVGAKLYAFTVAACIAALGGVLFAFRLPALTFSGERYGVFQSTTALQEAVIGGVGWIGGALVGGSMHPGSTGSRMLDLFGSGIERYIFLIGGILLVATALHAPDGVAANVKRILLARRRRRGRASAISLPATTKRHKPVDAKALRVRDLTVRFGGVTAVDSLSLDVEPGRVVGLIGPNGAGKTTVINAITGFVPPQHGDVLLGDERVNDWYPHRRARAGLGRSFQSLELFHDMSVLENLYAASEDRDRRAYLTDLVRPGKPRLTSATIAAISEFGLADDLDAYPTELPYGKQRLIAIARAVAAEPSVLLLDEPAAGLDESETFELGKLIRRLAEDWNMAVLLIEHDVSLIMRVCDEIYALEFGHLIAHGSPAEIRADERVIKAYLGGGGAHATESSVEQPSVSTGNR